MNRPEILTGNDDRKLAKFGWRYILRVQASSQGISSLMGPPIGLYFIFATANLTWTQSIELIICLLILIAVVNILLPLYISLSTPQAKSRLEYKFRSGPQPGENNEVLAWKEILTLPGRMAAIQVVTSNLLVTFPILLFMRMVAHATWLQVFIIAIGGTLAEMAILIQGVLYMDTRLAPVRRALIPAEPALQVIHLGMGQKTKQRFVTAVLLLSSLLTMGTLGYENFLSAVAPGANVGLILRQFELQLFIIGIAIYLLGQFLVSHIIKATTEPIEEMARTLVDVQKGDLTKRALIISSDETAQLTIRLNQLLDQLNLSRTELEQQINARTADLARKTSYLQAAAWVAHEAAGLQDIATLLSRTADLISSRFGFYHTGIFLLDDSGAHAVLQAASSEGGKRMLARGHRLDVGLQGLVGVAAYQNRSQVVMDVESDKNYYKNPDLPLTRSEAAIPLAARGRILGVLDIQSTEASAFSQDDIDLLLAMADQIGMAIQNARLIGESQDALQRLETATAENIRQVWRERAQATKRSYRYASMGLTAVTQLGNMPSANNPATNRMNIPITLRGQHLGTIVLRRTTETAWSETDRSLAIEIASQVGLALENARLLDEAQRHAAEEQSLSELTAHLSSSLDPTTILQTVVRELHQLPNVDEVSVYVTPTSTTAQSRDNSKN